MISPFIKIDNYQQTIDSPDLLYNKFPELVLENIKKIHKKYPLKISDYYLGLISKEGYVDDPIYQQSLPSIKELDNPLNLGCDGLGESTHMPVQNVIHRYPDRALIITTNQCPVLCRFCFRKRLWRTKQKQYITPENLEKACNYLKKTPTIKEVLLSGGDPLMLSDEYLIYILNKINSIKSIDTIRLCTRIPVTLPARINIDLIKKIKEIPSLWVLTHFNHPKELTEKSIEACKQFISAGIPVLNQTVLLKNINDKAEILEELFRNLVKIKVKPHYLFHIDPIEGATHFATGPEKGLEIMKKLRGKLSSLALPTFAIDLPAGGGKVPLQPNYQQTDGKYETIDGQYIDYPF